MSALQDSRFRVLADRVDELEHQQWQLIVGVASMTALWVVLAIVVFFAI